SWLGTSYRCSSFFCFFFQAEDGIRDFHVTGVQTCALPIYSRNTFSCGTSSGNTNVLRYQTTSVLCSCIGFANASSSFQAYGKVTGRHSESSNVGCCASCRSPTWILQPALKLRVCRGWAKLTAHHNSMHIVPQNFIISIGYFCDFY